MADMPPGSRTFRIYEADLSSLEKGVALLHEAAGMSPMYQRGDVQIAIEEAKRILSDVRWDYGPFSHVEMIPAGPQPETDE